LEVIDSFTLINSSSKSWSYKFWISYWW